MMEAIFPPKLRFPQEPHGVNSQKTTFFTTYTTLKLSVYNTGINNLYSSFRRLYMPYIYTFLTLPWHQLFFPLIYCDSIVPAILCHFRLWKYKKPVWSRREFPVIDEKEASRTIEVSNGTDAGSSAMDGSTRWFYHAATRTQISSQSKLPFICLSIQRRCQSDEFRTQS
jgi:hypothetical protein